MRKDDAVRLQHMLDAGREALGFARGRSRSDILWQTVKQDLPPLVAALEEALRAR
jgi:uncharacterized protein with HEPN domain